MQHDGAEGLGRGLCDEDGDCGGVSPFGIVEREAPPEAQELRTNTELTRAIHMLTTEIHQQVLGDATKAD